MKTYDGFWTCGSGLIELELTMDQAKQGCHQGACDDDIAGLRTVPAIKSQLDKINQTDLEDTLREFGAWDDKELANREHSLDRILWLACGDIVDGNF